MIWNMYVYTIVSLDTHIYAIVLGMEGTPITSTMVFAQNDRPPKIDLKKCGPQVVLLMALSFLHQLSLVACPLPMIAGLETPSMNEQTRRSVH